MTWDVERSRGEHLRTLEQIRVSMTVRRQAAIREIEQVGGESIHLRGLVEVVNKPAVGVPVRGDERPVDARAYIPAAGRNLSRPYLG